jgi:nucleoside diphosphate kinase
MLSGMKGFTLALLKPDLFALPSQVAAVQHYITHSCKLTIFAERIMHFSPDQARQFYHEHDGKSFQSRLVTYMSSFGFIQRFIQKTKILNIFFFIISSGPFLAMILAGPQAIQRWRTAIGPTKVTKYSYSYVVGFCY